MSQPPAAQSEAASSCTIVVPCFNEEQRLDQQAYLDYVDSQQHVKLLLVNDGSRDGTAAVLDGLAAARPERIQAHHLAKNGGKAEAVRQGMQLALDGGCDFVGFWDADLATPFDDIASFASILDERPMLDMVFGSRVNLLGRDIQRRLLRHYIGRVFATMASWLVQLPIYDTQCGAKLFRANEQLVGVLDKPFLSRWIFDVEIIARYMKQQRDGGGEPMVKRICEYPLQQWTDVAGSKIKLRDFMIVAIDLLRIRITYF